MWSRHYRSRGVLLAACQSSESEAAEVGPAPRAPARISMSPPSILMCCPVTNEDSSDARKQAILAMSEASPDRLIGCMSASKGRIISAVGPLA